nr:topless-related protein 1-like isoform X2 [Coffea arabica]
MTYFYKNQEKLSDHGDENSTRILLMAKLKRLIEVNPLIGDKLQFPTLQMSRLETLVKQRTLLMAKLKRLIEANPLIGDKLQFPTLQMSRLETLVKQSNAILKDLIINCPRIFYMRTLTVVKQLTPSLLAYGG